MTEPMRTPDEIMTDFYAGCSGQSDIDMHAVLWEILEDVLNSVKLASTAYMKDGYTDGGSIHDTVRDYVVNHYGDD